MLRYPIRYINRQFQKFFNENSITAAPILTTVQDDNDYYYLRQRILPMATKSEHARARRIASQMDSTQIHTITDPLVRVKLEQREQKAKSIIVHYTYEKRFAYYKSKIHQIWNTFFTPSQGIHTKLVVGTRNHANLTNELVRRSPKETYEKHNSSSIKNIKTKPIP